MPANPSDRALKKGKRCPLPELKNVSSKVSLGLALNRMFIGGTTDQLVTALLINFVRVVDALVDDYNALRDQAERYVTTPNNTISPLFLAISHAEECVTNLHRAIRFGQKLRNKDRKLGIGRPDCLTGPTEKVVREFRNSIQHLDDALVKGEWQPPDAHCLMVSDDRVSLHRKTIEYDKLVQWIKELHDIAVALSHYKETPP